MNGHTATSPTSREEGTPILEKIRPELNLEKWSVWQPAKSKNEHRAITLEREIQLPDGNKVTAQVEVGFTNRGALTTEDQRTYYALVKHWEDNGRSAKQTFFSLRRLAKVLKKKWGTNVIDALTQSLIRLRTSPFIWTNSYFDAATKKTVEEIDTFNILSDLKIIRQRQDGHTTKASGYFRFNDFILNNLLTNHTKPLFLDVVLNFESEIAQLLYVHLDLILADKNRYERRTKELFDDLGLEGKAYKNAANRKQRLGQALKEIQGVHITTGVIISATLEKTKDGKDNKVVFTKSRHSRKIAAAMPVEEGGGVELLHLPIPTKDPLVIQAEELVRYFYKLFQGVERSYPTSKEVDQAVSLIAQHGEAQAKRIIDFAHREAPKTNYEPQTFGGILQYAGRAIAEYGRREREEEQVRRQRAEETERRRQELEAEREAQELLAKLPPDEYETLYSEVKNDLITRYPQAARYMANVLDETIKTSMVKKLKKRAGASA